MLRFIGRRVLYGVILLFALATLAFFLLNAGAGDVGRQILGGDASDATVALKNHQLGLDRPLVVRYGAWLVSALHGDFGVSWYTSQPVTEAILSRFSVTISLVVGTVVVTAIVATLVGVLAARYGGWLDRLIQVISILGLAVPGFLIAIGLVNLFALQLHLFNATGYVPIGTDFGGWLRSVTLPIIALSIGSIAAVAQQVRGSVKSALDQDWVRTLRSRGVSESRVVYLHALRNAGGPALTVLALQFVGLLGGAVIVEQVFAIPGVGGISTTATIQSDIPLVLGLVVVVGALVVIINLVIDLVQGFLNPKVRLL